MKKNLLFHLMAICAISMLPFDSFAQVITWETGRQEIATWSYNEETSVLSISGSGTLDKTNPTEPTNFINEIINSAKEIIIGEGITDIKIFTDGSKELNNLEKVTLPSTLWENKNPFSVEIFNNCPKLQEAVFAEGTTSIYGFYNCDSIKSITIPSSVWSFNAFGGCDSLKSVYINDIKAFCGMNHNFEFSAFHYSPLCNVVQNRIFDERLNEYTVVMSEPRDLYLNGEKVVHLIIPDSIYQITPYTFAGCSAEKITLPKHNMNLGNCAFRGMTNLKSIEIPEDTWVGEALFEFCYSLKEITLNKDCTFGHMAMSNSPGMKLDKGIYTFSMCDSIENIILNEGVTELPCIFGRRYSNEHSSNIVKTLKLKSITIPSSLERIDISINSEIYRFHSEKDWWQTHPGYIRNANSQIYIGDTPIVWPSGDVVIPDGVTRIMGGKFYYIYNSEYVNTKVTSIKIPNSVTSIGGWAFEGLTAVKEITIPQNVEYIGELAFNNMPSLKSIIVESKSPAQIKPETWGNDEGFYDRVILYVPIGCKALYEEQWTGFKEIIELEGLSVESIEGEEQEKNIYNLNGVRIKEYKAPGIYIVNGKKTVIK